jgi:hypothetical protein
MSNQFSGATRALPDRPNLRHLKDQAKDLWKAHHRSSFPERRWHTDQSRQLPGPDLETVRHPSWHRCL